MGEGWAASPGRSRAPVKAGGREEHRLALDWQLGRPVSPGRGGGARLRARNMALLGAGGGCGGYEEEGDDSVFEAAVEVFAKLKVLRGREAAPGRPGPGGGAGRACCGSRRRPARRPSRRCRLRPVSCCGGRLVGRPSRLLGRLQAFILVPPGTSGRRHAPTAPELLSLQDPAGRAE